MALHQTVSTLQRCELHKPSRLGRACAAVRLRKFCISSRGLHLLSAPFKCLFDSSQGWDLLLSRLTGAGAVLVGHIAWAGCIGPALGALLALGSEAGCALAGCWP